MEKKQEQEQERSTGNRLKFKLDTMLMFIYADRSKEAGAVYDQLIEEFDKLA